MHWGEVPTRWGCFYAAWDGRGFCTLRFPGFPPPAPLVRGGPFLELGRQLDAYFSGKTQAFSLPLSLAGTPFQLAVWEELRKIPYGQVVSYGELAGRIGHPRAARAAGGAVGANPVPILVPCHRVVRADGGLGGFGPGLEWKLKLLELEGAIGKGPGRLPGGRAPSAAPAEA